MKDEQSQYLQCIFFFFFFCKCDMDNYLVSKISFFDGNVSNDPDSLISPGIIDQIFGPR